MRPVPEPCDIDPSITRAMATAANALGLTEIAKQLMAGRVPDIHALRRSSATRSSPRPGKPRTHCSRRRHE